MPLYRSLLSLSSSFLRHATGVVLMGLPIMGIGVQAVSAQHPTAVTAIVNSEADTSLEVNHNGSLLIPGALVSDGTENDSIPAEGAGVRMMWYPEKAAFRAGEVGSHLDGTQWDAANVGTHSIAFGDDTQASGNHATAMGEETTASAGNTTAMGVATTASSFAATAIGTATTASGAGATALGSSSEASGSSATAMGNRTTASAQNATAMNDRTTASGEGATAIGRKTTASGRYATAMGRFTTASGWVATAMGEETTASEDESLSIGQCNSANTTSDGTLFVAGNGTLSSGSCNRSDALVLNKLGDMTISGSLTENSDRRLKTSVRELNSVLGDLSALRPVRFQFKEDTSHPTDTQIGLIAQEVQKKFPELVSKGSEGYLSLAYPKMTAVLLKGLQEQQAQIESQKRQIDRQQSQLREKAKRITQLQTDQKQMRKRLTALEAREAPTTAGWAGGPARLVLAALLGGLIGAGLLHLRRG